MADMISVEIRVSKDIAAFIDDVAHHAGVTSDQAAGVIFALGWIKMGGIVPKEKARAKAGQKPGRAGKKS